MQSSHNYPATPVRLAGVDSPPHRGAVHDEAGAWACGVSRRPSGALAVVDARRVHPEARQSPLVPALQVHRRLQANLELAAQV